MNIETVNELIASLENKRAHRLPGEEVQQYRRADHEFAVAGRLAARGGREMSIATYLNTGLAILGWAYIMVKTGQWITKNALRQWDKRRKESRRQKAVNEFYDAFELNSLEPGSTVRLATKGDLTIMMFRSEGADK